MVLSVSNQTECYYSPDQIADIHREYAASGAEACPKLAGIPIAVGLIMVAHASNLLKSTNVQGSLYNSIEENPYVLPKGDTWRLRVLVGGLSLSFGSFVVLGKFGAELGHLAATIKVAANDFFCMAEEFTLQPNL